MKLVEHFESGLDAPICLTWELTYACNLECAHCLSSSGRRDPRELSTEQCEAVIDELQRMQVFYVNIGGGEPTIRPDFWHLLQYAVDHQVGVMRGQAFSLRARFAPDHRVAQNHVTSMKAEHVGGVVLFAECPIEGPAFALADDPEGHRLARSDLRPSTQYGSTRYAATRHRVLDDDAILFRPALRRHR